MSQTEHQLTGTISEVLGMDKQCKENHLESRTTREASEMDKQCKEDQRETGSTLGVNPSMDTNPSFMLSNTVTPSISSDPSSTVLIPSDSAPSVVPVDTMTVVMSSEPVTSLMSSGAVTILVPGDTLPVPHDEAMVVTCHDLPEGQDENEPASFSFSTQQAGCSTGKPSSLHVSLSNSSQTTPPTSAEGFLIKSAEGFQCDLTQSHLVQVDGRELQVMVKQELMEEGRRLMDTRGMEGEGVEKETCSSDCREVLGMATQGRNVLVKEEEEDGSMAGVTADNLSSLPLSTTSFRWSHTDTLRLIQLYKENRHYFADRQNKKKTVWAMLAGKLSRGRKSKVKFTGAQVYNRWKNLTKMYRDCVHDIQRAGTWVGKCRFFEEMATVYDASTLPHPKNLAHRVIRKRRHISTGQSARSNQHAGSNLRAIAPKAPNSAKELPVRPSNPAPEPVCKMGTDSGGGGQGGSLWAVVRAVQKLQEDQKAQDEWKMERLEVMHRESMQMFGRFLDILKDKKT